SFANERDMKSILDEFRSVRDSTIAFFNGLDDKVLKRTGIADGNIMSVRAAAYHIAGHELHHINIIKEKYL
ncbi:MAG: DinB family protein, partial [Bacteroidetes bacterium]|nr:DinB family protein [Bacteroidota bacterium]